jgi:nucleotide-binding universal stress UspA family protein
MSEAGPILVAYDGSAGADAAVAAMPPLFAGRPAVVVSVWDSIAPHVDGSLVAVPASVAHEAAANLDREAERQAAELAERGAAALRDQGFEASASALRSSGSTWATIVDCAERENAAAVVVGARGRSPVASALLGSVSTGLVHHCERPVLVVRG